MADVKLSNGKEITIDLYKINIKEYENMFDKDVSDEAKRALMCKTFNISVEEFEALPMPDGLQLQKAFWKRSQEPLADPNSESASS